MKKKSDIQAKESTEEPKYHRTPEVLEAFMKRLEKHAEKLKKIPGMINAYVE